MTDKAKDELFIIQEKYDRKELLFQEFKEMAITHIVAHSDVSDMEQIVEFILEN